MILEAAVIAGIIAAGLGAVYLVVKALRLRRQVMADMRQIQWIEEQYSKALLCLRSGEGPEILMGLQIIGAFNDPRARLNVLPEVRRLIDNPDSRVARHAGSVLDKILSDLADEAGHLPKASTAP